MLMNVNADGSGWLEILTFEQYYVNGPLSVNKDAGEWKKLMPTGLRLN